MRLAGKPTTHSLSVHNTVQGAAAPTLSWRVYSSMLGSAPQRTGMSRMRRAIGNRTLRSSGGRQGR